jgi:hypothetical protein
VPPQDQRQQYWDEHEQYGQIVSPRAARGFAPPTRPRMVVSGFDGSLPHEDQGPWSAAFQPAARVDDATADAGKGPPAPSTEGQPSSERPGPNRSVEQAAAGGSSRHGQRDQSAHLPSTVSRLLERLELKRNHAAEFQATLEQISRIASQTDDPADRDKSWDILRSRHWYSNIANDRAFSLDELTLIFKVVVIPQLAVRDTDRAIASWAPGITAWARDAAPLMIGGLLAAAREASPDVWQAVMGILEPVVAVRWVTENSIQEQWDARRAVRPAAELGRDDGKPRMLDRFRGRTSLPN